jgi:septal ring factor EnvC (AmiA/AmiB activator)
MTRREWIAPGILITVLTLGTNFVSDWAVERYRGDGVERTLEELKVELKKQNDSTNRRIDGLDDRLREMAKGASDTARLQEANRTLESRIAEMRGDIKEIEGRGQARFENLSTRLARAGF